MFLQSESGTKVIAVLALITIGISLELGVVGVAFMEKDFYLDLRSPVFRAQGALIKNFSDKKRGYIIVRGLKFTSNFGNEPLHFLTKDFKEGDEVAVEYSPRTKQIWKIEKTKDI